MRRIRKPGCPRKANLSRWAPIHLIRAALEAGNIELAPIILSHCDIRVRGVAKRLGLLNKQPSD